MEQDDLAETAHHDPVVLDHPSFDTEDYFSDWDEMSDEYYDDDPTVLKRQRMARKIAEAQGPKTKPTSARTPSIGSGIDPTSFQSVVWKSPPDHAHAQAHQKQLHPPGEGEKVALLKNWREVFRFSNPAIGRSRRKSKSKSKGPAAARSAVVDGKREDSSDRTSGALSLENLRENEIEGVESGDASNTTPAESASPRIAETEAEAEAGQDAEMADAPPAGSGRKKAIMKPSPSSNVVVEIPVLANKKAPPPPPTQADDSSPPKDAAPLPKKRGRKRKADLAPTPAVAGAEGGRDGDTGKRPRSTQVASREAGQAGDRSTRSSAGSVRRSTRQK